MDSSYKITCDYENDDGENLLLLYIGLLIKLFLYYPLYFYDYFYLYVYLYIYDTSDRLENGNNPLERDIFFNGEILLGEVLLLYRI